jgi:electron transport complex protein RnfG
MEVRMKRIAMRLTLIAACCGLLTSLAWSVTAPRVAANRDAWANRQLQEVAGNTSAQLAQLDSNLFRIDTPDGPSGFIFESMTNEGYNGRIAMWIAVSTEGSVLGVRVTEHRETPGIGDGIDLSVSGWILDFSGRSLVNPATWEIGQDFDKMFGATITSRAVVDAVHDGLVSFESNKHVWLDRLEAFDEGAR